MGKKQDLEDRLTRAYSWVEAARSLPANQMHTAFVFLYIAFNALYGRVGTVTTPLGHGLVGPEASRSVMIREIHRPHFHVPSGPSEDGAGTIHGDFIPEKVASACTRVSIEKRRREEG